jgi:hypothetical protein
MSDQQSAEGEGRDTQQDNTAAQPQEQRADELLKDGVEAHAQIRPRSTRRWPWILAAILVLLLAASGMDTFFGTFRHKALESHTFQVSGRAALVVHITSGSITVHNGENNSRVTIQVIKQAPLFSALPAVSYIQNGYMITASEQGNAGSIFGGTTLDFEITLPRSAELNLETATGQLSVQGISGEQSLSTGDGPIIAMSDTLSGSSTVRSTNGSIIFNGALAAHSLDKIASDTGALDVTLPRHAAYHLDVTSSIGTFSSSIGVFAHTFNTIGSEVHTNVGASPTATLILRTSTGPIDMHTS